MTSLPPEAVTDLAKQLIASARNCDWPAVAKCDQQVERLLRSFSPIPAELRSAVAELHAAHQRAHALAVQESAKVTERMARLRDNQDGLRAYQQSGELV